MLFNFLHLSVGEVSLLIKFQLIVFTEIPREHVQHYFLRIHTRLFVDLDLAQADLYVWVSYFFFQRTSAFIETLLVRGAATVRLTLPSRDVQLSRTIQTERKIPLNFHSFPISSFSPSSADGARFVGNSSERERFHSFFSKTLIDDGRK